MPQLKAKGSVRTENEATSQEVRLCPSESTTGQVQVSHRTENAGNLPKNYEHGPKPFVLNQSPATSEFHYGQACLHLEVLDEYDHDPRTPDKLFDQASF